MLNAEEGTENKVFSDQIGTIMVLPWMCEQTNGMEATPCGSPIVGIGIHPRTHPQE